MNHDIWLVSAGTAGASGFDYFQTVALLIAAASVGITAYQVRREAQLSSHARQADLSWSMYDAYIKSEIRQARGVAENLAYSEECPSTREEYLERVADGSPWREARDANESDDSYIRRLLRFYNQLAILLNKNLIDEDFVFNLVGTGLASSWSVLETAIEYYQYYYSRTGIPEWQGHPRPIYQHVPILYSRYIKWAQK